ncbi:MULTISPECIES: LysE family translocator [unclassified Streptomyces]|uniref:LysE family translocator n=1 Tax=unclassified Streptomyces TaxID=2593676 RepID=UPI002DDA1F07|nr:MULTISPECIES: LysE family translocator [unclassified Streptomyces]WSA92246.1 LysE family translocator [Streptomyces sp. NBC_01795]WSB76612.1 LysE family translocator [Streptomyces sp. NBC_01775]WSS15101.1 LysE family translocator [Streptomyces sp. NBC_01186]WSS43944.1 LysE family translocator [Streptomyces sp. NBC_01187]
MNLSTALWSFALVGGLLTITPGLDTALILRTAAVGRRRRARGVTFGIQSGILLWGALTSAGITAVLTASQLAYEILRWAGAAYLLWMGARMLAETFRRKRAGEPAASPELSAGPDTLLGGWRQGALTNLLNPKIGVFYVAVLPQFIPAGAPHFATGLLLTVIHIAIGIVWSTLLIACAKAVRGWLRKPSARQLLDRVTGTVIVGFGLHLALSE